MSREPSFRPRSSDGKRDRAWHPAADTPGYKSTTFRAPKHSLLALGPTRSELSGPTFGHEKLGPLDNDLIRNFSQDGTDAIGQRMVVYQAPRNTPDETAMLRLTAG